MSYGRISNERGIVFTLYFCYYWVARFYVNLHTFYEYFKGKEAKIWGLRKY